MRVMEYLIRNGSDITLKNKVTNFYFLTRKLEVGCFYHDYHRHYYPHRFLIIIFNCMSDRREKLH